MKAKPVVSWTAPRRSSCTKGSTTKVHNNTDRPPVMIEASITAWVLRRASRRLAIISRPAVINGYWMRKPSAIVDGWGGWP